MSSIRLRLLRWLIAPILLINLAGAALTYQLAWLPAQRAFDQSLAAAAGALGARLQPAGAIWRLDLPPQAEQVLRNDAADAIYFVVRAAGGGASAGDADFPPLPAPPAGAPQAYDSQMRGEAVRVVALAAGSAQRPVVIGVAKTLRQRSQMRGAIVRALLLLESLLTLATVGLIWFAVGKGLQPLTRLRSALNGRRADELAPLPSDLLPDELEPVLQAFNSLLARVSDDASARQTFLANVAHQLRTPLAGLRTQLEWLAQRHADPETAASVGLMRASTERMIRQTRQLLALARAEPSHFQPSRLDTLALDALVGESVQDFVEQAARKRIDLGFELAPASVRGEGFMLRDLIDNLVDNAIRYTPARGRVTVRCRVEQGGAVLQVEDSGPGIAPDKREQVFNRFVRLDQGSSGSGLGLAIVRDIAQVHGAAVSVAAGADGGACFTVRFPA